MLLARATKQANPMDELADVLRASLELLSLNANNITWSKWKTPEEALDEVESLLKAIVAGTIPPRSQLSSLFAPTGSLQEVSLSSGWGEIFLQISERYDGVEKEIYGF
jgi:hypothetical protein